MFERMFSFLARRRVLKNLRRQANVYQGLFFAGDKVTSLTWDKNKEIGTVITAHYFHPQIKRFGYQVRFALTSPEGMFFSESELTKVQ